VGNRESGRHQKYVVPPVAGAGFGEFGMDGVVAFMEGYLGEESWRRDLGILPGPWRREVVEEMAGKAKLKIGWVMDDGVILPQPPVQRAMKEMVDRLKKVDMRLLSETVDRIELRTMIFS
jgi:amidase